MRVHPGYPRHWEADVVLRDGRTAHLRPITPQDADALQRFHGALSPESLHLRFFGPVPRTLTPRQLRDFTTVDHVDRVALVAVVGDELIGVCRYERLDAQRADVAFAVLDTHHGRGLGSVFLEHLAAAARERHIAQFVADVLPQNKGMLNVFREAGYDVTHQHRGGLIKLVCDLDPTEQSVAVMESREHRAESASLGRLLNPSAVAVIGASRDPDTISSRVLSNLRVSGYTGSVYVVNPHAAEVQGIRSCPRVTDLPGPVDIAVILVPSAALLDVVRDCAAAGVHGLVIMSSTDDGDGDEGLARQRKVVDLARMHGMRIVGPSTIGVLNTDPGVRLNASLADHMPEPGGLALFSQSGSLGVAVLASAARRRLGISSFVSAGDRADVSTNDCLQYWEDDTNTAAVGLYLESMGNPRKFSRIARRISHHKPIVAVKSGVSGYAVPPGHSVRRTRAPRAAMDSLLHQAGVIRVDTIHQLFDVSQLLLHQPLPAGPRIGIVSNSHAMAVLVADAAAGGGLDVAAEPMITQPEPHPADFREAVTAGFNDANTDAIVVCYVPPLGVVDESIPQALQEISAASVKTTAACMLGFHGVVASGQGRAFPSYPTPEDAVRALVTVAHYAARRREPVGRKVDHSGINRTGVQDLVEEILSANPTAERVPLNSSDAARLLTAYGVGVPSEATNERSRPAAALRGNYVLHTVEDQLFGPVLSLARADAGSNQPVYRIPPLTDTDIADLIREVDTSTESAVRDGSALEDLISRVSCLSDDVPELVDLALVVSVDDRGYTIRSVSAHLGLEVYRTDSGHRRLTST